MKKVDLYLINSDSFAEQINFCCRLVEKAFSKGLKIHIQTEQAFQNEALNDALWSFKAESFLPHAIGQHHYKENPITIDTLSVSHHNEGHRDLLILLNTDLPSNYADFERMSILVINLGEKIQAARHIYKQLKSKNIEVNIHDLRSKKP